MAKEITSKKFTYLKINKDGYFYQSSKEPKEGYEEVKLKDGSKIYQKLYSETEEGLIDRISIYEATFDSGKVKYLNISIGNDGATDVISLPFHTPNKDLSDALKGLITMLPNLDYSHKYVIGSNHNKDERGYVQKRLIFKDLTTGEYIKAAHKFGEQGDIPPAVKKTKASGDVTYDFTEQDNYLFKIFEKELERFRAFKGTSEDNIQESEPTADKPSSAKLSVDEDDELPF